MAGPFRVTRDGPVPIYAQVRSSLLRQIESGELQPGRRAPSDREIAESLGISRMTARAGVASLVNDGYLYAVPGKGTFVANPDLLQDLRQLTSFTEDMRRRGFKPGGRVIEFVLDNNAVPGVHKELALFEGERLIRITRLRTADEEPICIETSHLREAVARWLLEENLNDASLYELLRSHGIDLRRAEEYIEATLVPKPAAELLNVAEGSPALLIRRVTYSNYGVPVEYVRSLYRGDRYRFHTVLTR